MHRVLKLNRTIAAQIGRFLFAVLLLSSVDVARSTAQPAEDPVLQAWLRFPETFVCRQCHYEAEPAPAVFGDFTKLKWGDFSKQNEMYEWVRHDKHAIARVRVEPLSPDQIEAERQRILDTYDIQAPNGISEWVGPSNELSYRICRAMGFDIATPDGYQRFADQCLNCHGGHRPAEDAAGSFAMPNTAAVPQPGISCLYCHQQPGADTPSTWVQAHASLGDPKREWRLKPPAEKRAAGMRDLVTTSLQADLCNDCHIGNLNKGMFISHDMYAAGHPPLPNVELETYCRSMPQHWQPLGELYQSLQQSKYPGADAYFAINFPGLAEEQEGAPQSWNDIYWDTRKVLVGAAAADRRSAEMLVWAAEQGKWGDYALYDCGACHHELQRPSLRQQRGYPGAPGRPRLPEWPSALLVLIAAPGSKPTQEYQALIKTVAEVPFGESIACKKAAEALISTLNANIAEIESSYIVDRRVALNVIERLSAADEHQLVDYATARQVMWAIMIAADQLAADPLLSADQREIVQSIQDEIAAWRGTPPADGALVASGSVGISTELPSGRGMFIFPENLSEELERKAAYEPAQLAASLERIHVAAARGLALK